MPLLGGWKPREAWLWSGGLVAFQGSAPGWPQEFGSASRRWSVFSSESTSSSLFLFECEGKCTIKAPNRECGITFE